MGRKPSTNSSPLGASSAPDTMRIGTCGFSSFISRAISVPVLALRKWSAITKLTGCCFNISSPASPDEAVRTSYPALLSSSVRTRNARSSSSMQRTTGYIGPEDEDVIGRLPERSISRLLREASPIANRVRFWPDIKILNCRESRPTAGEVGAVAPPVQIFTCKYSFDRASTDTE